MFVSVDVNFSLKIIDCLLIVRKLCYQMSTNSILPQALPITR